MRRPAAWPTVPRLMSLRWPPRAAIVFCGILGTLLPAIFGTVMGVPDPTIHDEFSYLLGADTIAHGRLTNPSPALPEFFEAPHVLVVPSYASKYPPGQPLFLALGQMAGQPIWGVWLGCGLFAAALCWMLQAWSSRKWALTVTVLAIVTLGTSTYWAQSYWGGMPAATGAALMLGGLRWTMRRPRAIASVLTAAGAVLLANTRPYEGLLVCLPAAALLGHWLIRAGAPWRVNLMSVIVPGGAVLLAGAGAMALYNHAVTGDAMRTPYGLHLDQYFGRGVFLFSPRRQPERTPPEHVARFYASDDLPAVHGTALIEPVMQQSIVSLVGSVGAAFGLVQPHIGGRERDRGALLWLALLISLWANLSNRMFLITACVACLAETLLWWWLVPLYPFSLWLPMAVAWIMAFAITFDGTRWSRLVVLGILSMVLGQSLVWWWWSHYAAPSVPLILAGAAMALQRLARIPRSVRHKRPLGAVLVLLIAAHTFTLTALSAAERWISPTQGARLSRGDVARQLGSRGGRHLVFVHYEPDASIHVEWVFNPADLNAAPVVFAHDLGPAKNSALIAAMPSRSIWAARVSPRGNSFAPYPDATSLESTVP